MNRLAAARTLHISARSALSCRRCPPISIAPVCPHLRNFSSNREYRQQPQDTLDLFARYSKKSIVSQDKPIRDGWQLLSLGRTTPAEDRSIQKSPESQATPYRPSFLAQTEKDDIDGERVYLRGYISSTRKAGKSLFFVDLVDPYMNNVTQLFIQRTREIESKGDNSNAISANIDPYAPSPWTMVDQLRPHTPVEVIGTLKSREGKASTPDASMHQDPYMGRVQKTRPYEVIVDQVTILNELKTQQVIKSDTIFPPEQRHLQFRTRSMLRDSIRKRSFAMAQCRKRMFMEGFDEIETPVLFKSTPEGAREFIVPTRQSGMAYALTQSPQQYKQLLMASGVHKYFQFAKCFRDEDLRTDRQPEFTQLDIEASFSGPEDIRALVDRLYNRTLRDSFQMRTPRAMEVPFADDLIYRKPGDLFPVITYADAMRYYGSDKPNLKIPGHIVRIDQWLPQGLKSMLTSLEDPIVEAIKIRPSKPNVASKADPAASRDWLQRYMDSSAGQAATSNPDGMPGIAIIDSTKPIQGLAAFGHEAAEEITKALDLEEGDILIAQSRPNKPTQGGSTPLGEMRVHTFRIACKEGLIDDSDSRKVVFPLWVVDFPLFSPLSDGDLKHTSASGFCSTHHPFTSPVPELSNLEKLKTNPLEVIGDHFDLVMNGIEVGGGSRRIHDADMQEYILREILKLPDERVKDFDHLLKAFRDGCPPHVGFAIGFDRLMTILNDMSRMRDVIAFPKTGDGEDRMVGAPSKLTEEQLTTYHLEISSRDSGNTAVPADVDVDVDADADTDADAGADADTDAAATDVDDGKELKVSEKA